MNITVYCGAALGNVPAYQQATIELGKWLAQHHHRLIYGGGKAGLMGLLADTVLSHGGGSNRRDSGIFTRKGSRA